MRPTPRIGQASSWNTTPSRTPQMVAGVGSAIISIASIQGTNTDTSPYKGQTVTTEGVVTAVYATGGLAWGAITHTLQTADNFGFSSSDRKSTLAIGYSVGGGIEHAFSSRLSVKLEYQYIDLGSEHYKAPLLFGTAATAFAMSTYTHTDFHTVRVGLYYKFHDRGEAPLK